MKLRYQSFLVKTVFSLILFSIFLNCKLMASNLDMANFTAAYQDYLQKVLDNQKINTNDLRQQNEEILGKITNLKKDIETINHNYENTNEELSTYISQYSENWNIFARDVKVQKKKYFIKLFSTERSYINCLNNALDLRDHIALKMCEHKSRNVKDTSVLALNMFFNSYLSMSLKDAEIQKKESTNTYHKELSNLSRELMDTERRIIDDSLIAQEEDKLKKAHAALQEFSSFMDKYFSMLQCDSSTPTINMEEQFLIDNGSTIQGVLYQSPRDDQTLFQTGTCYSHVTKDMFTAILKGTNSPSFFDLANIYSKKRGRTDDLDGGDPCPILDAVYDEGYCPYQFSAFEYFNAQVIKKPELAVANSDVQNLWNKIYLLSSLITKDNSEFYKAEVVQKFDLLIDTMNKQLSHFSFFQGIPAKVFPSWKQQEFFSLIKKSSNINIKDIESFNQQIDLWISVANIKLTSQYREKIFSFCTEEHLADACNTLREEIYQFLIADLKLYVQRTYGDVASDLLKFHHSVKDDVFSAISHPHYQLQIQSIAAFLDQEPVQDVVNTSEIKPNFLSIYLLAIEILSISKEIEKKSGIDFKPVIKFIAASSNPIQQLLSGTAPGCKNPKIRRDIPKGLICETHSNPTRSNKVSELQAFGKELYRYTILKNLLAKNSVPIGNIISAPGGLHIHSIVGMRFDEKSQKCQYLIRESNGARSDWTFENDVIESSNGLKIIKPEFHRY